MKTTAPEPHTGLQGESGACRHRGRLDIDTACRAVRRSPQSDHLWKAQLEGGAADVFGPGSSNGAAQPAIDVKSLHAKIGELTLENDFLEGALSKAGLLSAKR